MDAEAIKKIGEPYWKNIDPDKFLPICHGTPRTAEELEIAQKQFKIVEEKLKEYHRANGTEYKDGRLFPELE